MGRDMRSFHAPKIYWQLSFGAQLQHFAPACPAGRHQHLNTSNMKETRLGEFEEVILLLVGILGEDAYAYKVAEEFESQT
jgi:hypothetical protein